MPNVQWKMTSHVGPLDEKIIDTLKKTAVNRGDAPWGMTGPRDYYGTMINTTNQSYTIGKPKNTQRYFELQKTSAKPTPLKIHKKLSQKLPPGIMLTGEWISAKELAQRGMKLGMQENIFGDSGVFITPMRPMIFPQYDITDYAEGLPSIGVQLVKLGDPLPLTKTRSPIMLASYYFGTSDQTDRYQREYALPRSGGFIEKHPFPQLFAPMSHNCGGYIVIGKEMEKNVFYLTAVKIPFGYILVTAENVIHGDTFFKGPYLASLSFVGDEDTVFIKNKAGKNVPFNRCGEKYNIGWGPKDDSAEA